MFRLTFILSLLMACTVTAVGSAQKVSIRIQKGSLEDVLSQMSRQVGVQIVYDPLVAEKVSLEKIVYEQAEMRHILNEVLPGTGLRYEVVNGAYIIREEEVAVRQQRQPATVRGRVTGEGGAPLVGVTVLVKGTTRGVATDADGNYLIQYDPEHTTLEISYVGYKKAEVAIGGRTEVNVRLEPRTVSIGDVVVTGYQTISRERATGAYSVIGAERLEQKPSANVSDALNGLVPGLSVQSSPLDGNPRFIIRGQGTLQESQMDRDPLIVVDGFPINGYDQSASGSSSMSSNPLAEIKDPFSTINPNDVESITVLKDAAATSIYGARAANGVIVITTKKGRGAGRLDISADAYVSVSSRADLDYYFNMASGENQIRFVELMHRYSPINLTGSSDPYLTPSARMSYMSAPYGLLFERDGKGHITAEQYNSQRQRLAETGRRGLWKDDLNDHVFRNAVHRQYNVAIRGASEKIDYAFSAAYDDEDGYLRGNSNRRVLLNMSSSTRVTKNLTFDLNLNTVFARRENNAVSISQLRNSLSPWSRLVDDDGEFVHLPTGDTVYEPILRAEYEGKTPASWLYNPVEDRQYTDQNSRNMNYRVHGGFEYATLWGLRLSAKGQYEWRRFASHTYYDPESYHVRNYYNIYSTLNEATGTYTTYFPNGGIFADAGDTYEGYNLRGQADYNLLRDRHELTLLAGVEILSSSTETTPQVTRYGYNKYTNSVMITPDYMTRQYNIFGVYTAMPYDALGTLRSIEDRFFSVYANAAYTYDGRLSLTASFRTDASNFQATEVRKKFSPFWSVGTSWLISRERFMEDAAWVNMLKLRASYGLAGVAAGKSGTSSVTTVAVHPGNIIYTDNQAFNSVAARGNPTLTWEKSCTLNVGLDFGLWGNRLFGSVEFYNKFSFDVLSNATVAVISQGITAATFNNAEVLNRGIELSVGANLRIAGDLHWRGTLNYAYNHNEVKKYNVTTSFDALYPGYVEGYPVGFFTALKAAGYSPEGFIILQGKDGSTETVTSYATSHFGETIARQDGETIDSNNWVHYVGSSTPTGNLGFSSQFTWKGLTLSFMLTGRFGYYVERGDHFSTATNFAAFSRQLDNAFRVYDEGYASQTSYTAFPIYNDDNHQVYEAGGAYTYAYNIHMKMRNTYIRGDHVRLNEVYLGYELPDRWLSRQRVLSRVNVYAQAANLGLLWSANGEMDPDYRVGSLRPMARFTFGVKLNFR